MTPSENSASRPRTWQEAAEVLLSLLDCLVPEREAVFASLEESACGEKPTRCRTSMI